MIFFTNNSLFLSKSQIFGLFLFFVLAGCGGNDEEGQGDLTQPDEEVYVEDMPDSTWGKTDFYTEEGDIEETAVESNRVDRLNTILVRRGRLYKETDHLPRNVTPITEEDITTSLDAWQAEGNPMFLYFHGGLVNTKRGLSQPNKNGMDSTLRANNLFPYYFIYDAGIFSQLEMKVEETDRKITKALEEIKADGFFKFVGKFIKRKIAEKFNLGNKSSEKMNINESSLAQYDAMFEIREEGIPDYFIEEYVSWEDTSISFTAEELDGFEEELELAYENAQIKEQIYSEVYFEKENLQKRNENQNAKNIFQLIRIGKIIKGVVKRFRNNRDHGFLLTVFEEFLANGTVNVFGSVNIVKWIRKIVKWVWSMSKENVNLGFSDRPESAGTNLLHRLKDMEGDITLSGSSTGAIYVCEFIKKMKEIKAEEPSAFEKINFRVILVVAAAKFTLFQEAFSHTEELFDNEDVLLLSLSDEMEHSGLKTGFHWPIGSTLYLVSSTADDADAYHDLPILGMERFFIERRKQKKLSQKDMDAIDSAYSYLGYGTSFPKMVVSHIPHPKAPYLRHNGTRHTNLMKDSEALESMALFARYGYERDIDLVADESVSQSGIK